MHQETEIVILISMACVRVIRLIWTTRKRPRFELWLVASSTTINIKIHILLILIIIYKPYHVFTRKYELFFSYYQMVKKIVIKSEAILQCGGRIKAIYKKKGRFIIMINYYCFNFIIK